ncbi:hypothetical protein ABZ470_26515 [Streptosporangium sp. NPDC020072]|uniref:hypothetical protein n=1 Tax=Streptosporangium sp. NPDC020072 TaxID=3154788 RepID=UPI003433893D
MRRTDRELMTGCLTLVALLVLAVVIGLIKTSTGRVETATVESKERVCDSSRNCRYLIFTDQGVYENTDALLSGKFNSSDIYGALKPGHTYRFKINGWRIPATSSYPNILSIEGEVTK